MTAAGPRILHLLALWLGKVVLVAARVRGGGGSAIPGLVVEKVDPGLLPALVARLPRGCVLVTGTNGKTTSVKMLTRLLEAGGVRVVTNRTGSNMRRGLLSAVIEQASWTGHLDGDVAVFEVDEPNMPVVAAALEPRVTVVLNLHRDQLDRYGELERTAELVGASLPAAGEVVLNADDPLVARLAAAAGPATVRWFGAAPDVRALLPDDANLLLGTGVGEPAVPADELAVAVGHVDEHDGRQTVVLRGPDGTEHTVDLPLPGVYNAVNAAAVVAAADACGVAPATTVPALAGVEPAFGRGERITVDDRTVVLQLVKNPSSFTQVIRTQLVHGEPRHLLVAINDNFADGRDVSWLWDVDFEALTGRGDHVLASGLRGTDLAVRLKYAGIPCDTEPDLDRALRRFLDEVGPGGTGVVVPTYTAMLDLRERLGRRAPIGGFWE